MTTSSTFPFTGGAGGGATREHRSDTPTLPPSLERKGEPLALYIHWPFCISKCPYCDFNSHVRDSVDQSLWRTSLLSDLAHEAALTPGRKLQSIFFGGGTPSLMPPETVAALLDAAERHWGFAPDIEITLEANPSSVEAARFADIAAAGVNRVSLGLQALDDAALRFLGRAHDVSEGIAALDVAQSVFDRVTFDLIYARPDQSPDDWHRELLRALALGTGHLSLYQLTIEDGTRFATDALKGSLIELDPDRAADLFEATRATTAAAGLPAYEVSNHAKPGQQSRHNLAYWRYQDYLGIGPGAHGRRLGQATVRHKKPENWLRRVAATGHGLQVEDRLPPRERATEALLMGLRLDEGVDLAALTAKTGVMHLIDPAAERRLTTLGFLTRHGTVVRVMPAGMLLLDAILADLVVT